MKPKNGHSKLSPTKAPSCRRPSAAKSRERVKGKAEELIGAAKNRVGHMIGNERLIATGKAKELKGEARQKTNK